MLCVATSYICFLQPPKDAKSLCVVTPVALASRWQYHGVRSLSVTATVTVQTEMETRGFFVSPSLAPVPLPLFLEGAWSPQAGEGWKSFLFLSIGTRSCPRTALLRSEGSVFSYGNWDVVRCTHPLGTPLIRLGSRPTCTYTRSCYLHSSTVIS